MPSAQFSAFYGIVNGLIVVHPTSIAPYTMTWGTSLSLTLDDGLDSWEPIHVNGPSNVEFSVYNGISANFEVLLEGGRAFMSSITTYQSGDPAPIFTADPFLVCFLAGTRIATPRGEVAVECLARGDLVLTADGRAVPVRWVGRQWVPNHPLLMPAKRLPVCIAAGALGEGLPHTDLHVTADHGMIWEGLLVNAGAMVNGGSIRFVPSEELPEGFTCYHIETEAHEVVLANGAPSETFVDYVTRSHFNNYQEYLDLHGAERVVAEMRRPRVSAQRMLPDALRAKLGLGRFGAGLAAEGAALLQRLKAEAAEAA